MGTTHRLRNRAFVSSLIYAILVLSPRAATIRTEEYASRSQAVNAAQAGDVVIFGDKKKEDDGRVVVTEPLRDVHFHGAEGDWELRADLEDCLFRWPKIDLIQYRGRLRRSIFYHPHYSCDFQFNHADSVMLYYDNYCKPDDHPRIQLYGFVRGVTIHKFRVEGRAGSDPGSAWNYTYEPVVRINATHPEGNGWGTYILSPIIWQQRNWTPFHVARGKGITLAHINTEYNRNAEPIMDVDYGEDCVLLCNGVGAAKACETSDCYQVQPGWITYPDGRRLGHPEDNVPFRGAAFRMAGQRNKTVANGDYKTWSLGRRAWLPCLHYGDQVVFKDPHFQSWPCKRGIVSANFCDPVNAIIMGFPYTGRGKGVYVPVNPLKPRPYVYPTGPDLIRPVLLRLPERRGGSAKSLAKGQRSFGPAQTAEIVRRLEKGETVQLSGGAFLFGATLTKGRLEGAGRDRTIIRFPRSVVAARTPFAGFGDLTVAGAAAGYVIDERRGPARDGLCKGACFVNDGTYIGRDFSGATFDGCGVGILINGNSQNDIIQEAKFVNCDYGIRTGSISAGGGRDGDPNVDKLDITNCDFANISSTAIMLAVDANHDPNGQIAVSGCTFTDIGQGAVYIKGGQTHLVQACTITRAGTNSSDAKIIYGRSFQGGGALAVSHVSIDNSGVNGSQTGIYFDGVGAMSNITMAGVPVAVSIPGEYPPVIDHAEAPEGELVGPVGTYLGAATFRNVDAAHGVKIKTIEGWEDHSAQAGVPSLDATPPPEVGGVSVRREGGANVVSWGKVEDPESGITGYLVYSNGTLVGRTEVIISEASTKINPFWPPTPVARFEDTRVDNTNYTVRAVNGANIISGGGQAPVPRWTAVTARFVDQTGTAVEIADIDHGSKQVTTADSRTLGYNDLGHPDYPVPKFLVSKPGAAQDHSQFVPDYYGKGQAMVVRHPGAVPSGRTLVALRSRTFTIGRNGRARLALYNALGREVGVLARGTLPAGTYTYAIPGRLSKGVYFVRLWALGESRTVRHLVGAHGMTDGLR